MTLPATATLTAASNRSLALASSAFRRGYIRKASSLYCHFWAAKGSSFPSAWCAAHSASVELWAGVESRLKSRIASIAARTA